MKLSSCLLIFIPLLQLMTPGSVRCSLDSVEDKRIEDTLKEYKHPFLTKKLLCVSITSLGRLSSCPAGMAVTSCACGYACGSWDVRGTSTCHCQCAVIDWTTARCCRLV
uniref:Resistin like beta n=1 Tax=Sciurus vulgaris TaxID=55149 RepID=A0A8D2CN69_SCIVU